LRNQLVYISAGNDNAFAGDDSPGINSIGELLKQSQLRFTNWANQATLLLMKHPLQLHSCTEVVVSARKKTILPKIELTTNVRRPKETTSTAALEYS